MTKSIGYPKFLWNIHDAGCAQVGWVVRMLLVGQISGKGRGRGRANTFLYDIHIA